MKAMILAAGLGTRLRPLTDDRPKALVEIGGRTLLEITLRRLSSCGIRDVIINVFHFADQIIGYMNDNHSFGMRIEISREEILLDTGGGLKRAAWFFRDDSEQFIVHNVDVISTIDLNQMTQFHRENQALATLAVQGRKTSRPLVFDEKGIFRGRLKEPVPNGSEGFAFSGVHVISPQLLGMMCEEGPFSIIDAYIRLASQGQKIQAFRADEYYWRDLGKPENIVQAQKDAEAGLFQL